MARYIHCEECKEKFQSRSAIYGEFYETLKGRAVKNMNCDSCDKTIAIETECYAAVLLNKKDNVSYFIQKPENWAQWFMEVIYEPERAKENKEQKAGFNTKNEVDSYMASIFKEIVEKDYF